MLLKHKEDAMQKTAHSDARMNQRGITGDLIELVMSFGEPDGDKTILNARNCNQAIEALKQFQKKLEHASKKGGLTVVSSGDTVITTYRADSFSAIAAKKSRG